MEKRLITAALPYVNNIPHLGNLIQVLSADVFARYCRMRGYETLYICGTDEYGTATETRALEEGVTPGELCERYFAMHAEIYRWFGIDFDKFGRTTTEEQTRIVQHIFTRLDENGFISPQTIKQLYCTTCSMFLADRYVHGGCPHCGYEEARGDQCESCGKLLDPLELVDPKCATCASAPEVRETEHLYLNLPALKERLEPWLDRSSSAGFWAQNAVNMTRAWIRDGLKERGITRDLTWGIPVPKDGYRNKVFYVWFDACIGYISITATHTADWEGWWRNPDNVRLYQFIGKDNIPFHTVVFPSALLGTDEVWTMLHHMSSTEYLNYEGGKFSKSKGVGVFGADAQETGIPADVWRFYITYNRPEKADAQFTWKDFREKVNSELIGNLSNLVNRSLTFLKRSYAGRVPDVTAAPAQLPKGSRKFWEDVRTREEGITAALERVELREAFRQIFALASVGNKRFQDEEPWKVVKTDPGQAAPLLRDLAYLVRDLAVLISPYLPHTAARIAGFLGVDGLAWEDLGKLEGLGELGEVTLLFARLEEDRIAELRERFSGARQTSSQELFRRTIELRVARITRVERHPEADKLYVETVDLGEAGGGTRQIVSGLVGHYTPEQLEGRNVVLAANLKPARLRGVESNGMLLAAEAGDIVEVVFADHATPGERVVLAGDDPETAESGLAEVDIDEFFKVPLSVRTHVVGIEGLPLTCGGRPLETSTVAEGTVG